MSDSPIDEFPMIRVIPAKPPGPVQTNLGPNDALYRIPAESLRLIIGKLDESSNYASISPIDTFVPPSKLGISSQMHSNNEKSSLIASSVVSIRVES